MSTPPSASVAAGQSSGSVPSLAEADGLGSAELEGDGEDVASSAASFAFSVAFRAASPAAPVAVSVTSLAASPAVSVTFLVVSLALAAASSAVLDAEGAGVADEVSPESLVSSPGVRMSFRASPMP